MKRREFHRPAVVAAALITVAVWGAACQNQGTGGGTQLPGNVVVWGDPDNLENRGRNVRDANNDEDSFILIGTNGRVQFEPLRLVCDDCTVDGATIELDTGQLIDIRFGIGPDGTGGRRVFLVDRASGEFIELLGGGSSPVEFRRSGALFEDADDRSDDQAVAVDETPNPTTSTSSGSSSLCGIFGMILPLAFTGMLALCLTRRRY